MNTPQRFLPTRTRYVLTGMFCAILAGIATSYLIETIWGENLPHITRLLTNSVVCVLVILYAHYRFDKKIATITEELRKAGTLPPKETAGDTDILHLANTELPEEAALLYKSLHKSTIEQAKLAVGLDTSEEQFKGLFWILAVGSVFQIALGARNDNPALTISGALFAIGCALILLQQRQIRRKAEANRALITAGTIPTTKHRA